MKKAPLGWNYAFNPNLCPVYWDTILRGDSIYRITGTSSQTGLYAVLVKYVGDAEYYEIPYGLDITWSHVIGDIVKYYVRQIATGAINNSNTSFVIPTSVSEVADNAFLAATAIYVSATSKPVYWSANLGNPSIPIYYYSATYVQGRWHYVNNVPTLW